MIKTEAQAKKLEFVIDYPIEVDGHTTTLRVQGVLNVTKATWAVSTKLTTKMADPSNPEVNAAVIKTAAENMGKMVEKMIDERQKILQPNEGEQGQFTIDFTAPKVEKKNFAGQEDENEPMASAPQ